MMKERPILFSGPMVRAILEGRKTQTRRVCAVGKKVGRNTIALKDYDGEMLLVWEDKWGYCPIHSNLHTRYLALTGLDVPRFTLNK